MTTLTFEDGDPIVLANIFSAERQKSSSEYTVGFVEGYRAASAVRADETVHWHRVAEELWWAALQALLLLEPGHPARRTLETTLHLNRRHTI